MMRSILFSTALVMFLFATCSSAQAMPLASQDFNSLDDGGTFVSDALADGTVRGTLTNAGSENSGGAGLDFDTVWTDTNVGDTILGPIAVDGGFGDSSDFIGVTSFTGGGNNPDAAAGGTAVASGSEHLFEFNDCDGLCELIFEPVDTSSAGGPVAVSLNYWITSTTWESGDSLTVSVSDDGGATSTTLLSLDEVALDAQESLDGPATPWQSFSADISGLGLGSNVTLIVGVDNDSGSENIFVDNIAFTVVPEPVSIALACVGALGLGFLRRR